MVRNGNPNAPANPYAPRRTGQAFPGQTNNPASYGQQRAAGQMANQPNAAGYGGGTNTVNYQRGGTQQPPLNPSIPTPVPQPPVYNNPANQAQIDAMWWLKPGAMDHVVPGGRDPNQPYTFADGRVGHMVPPGMTPTPGTGYAYGPRPGSMQGFGQMLGNVMGGGGNSPWGGGGMSMMDMMRRNGY